MFPSDQLPNMWQQSCFRVNRKCSPIQRPVGQEPCLSQCVPIIRISRTISAPSNLKTQGNSAHHQAPTGRLKLTITSSFPLDSKDPILGQLLHTTLSFSGCKGTQRNRGTSETEEIKTSGATSPPVYKLSKCAQSLMKTDHLKVPNQFLKIQHIKNVTICRNVF